MKKIFFTIIVLSTFSIGMSAQSYSSSSTINTIGKEQVVAQMNYCINSITNIVHYKSMPLLEHEIDQLLNNLTMEQVVGLRDVQSFHSEMLYRISELKISEEEKELIKRVQELQRENMLYQSISNSLNPTMLLTGGGNSGKQLAFMAIVTVARTAVEYKSASNEADIEELKAMWQYRKKDLENFAVLRKDALELVYNLFQKYNLNESDRLTEATSTLFSQIIAEPDPHARVRKLTDNKTTFSGMADYYYYTGMAYVDAGEYSIGRNYLNTYLSMYQKAPIFRYDEKSGCIALTKLALESGLSKEEVNNLVDNAISNLPNNGPALIQCVLALNDTGEKEKAFNLLRSGIDNHLISDKDALIMLATKLMSEIKHYPSLYNTICAAIANCKGLSVNSYLPFLLESDLSKFWKELPNVIGLDEKGAILISPEYVCDIRAIGLFEETHKKERIVEEAFSLRYNNSISLKTINKKFPTIKTYPETIYMFFDPISENETFKIKDNLDLQKVLDGTLPGLEREYSFEKKERQKIVSFCKKNSANNNGIIKISKNKRIEGKRYRYQTSYCDYMYYPKSTRLLSIGEYNPKNQESLQCQIESRKGTGSKIYPFKEQPHKIARLEFYGIDTISICFNLNYNCQPYSVSNGSTIYYSESINTIDVSMVKDETKFENESQKESWFVRTWHRIFNKSKNKDSGNPNLEKVGKKTDGHISDIQYKKETPNTANDESVSWISKVFHKVFSKSSTIKDAHEQIPEEKETGKQKKGGESDNSKDETSWLGKLWDKICFWK